MSENLINCKVCGKEIARSAKVCPHCGKKNKQPVWKIVLIVAVVVIMLSIIGNMPSSRTSNTPEASTADTPGSNSSVTRSNNLGIWGLGEYEDQFGNNTGEKFIAIRSMIRGKFSNPVTENSDLDVQVSYSEKNGMIIQMYEYGKQLGNPVSAIGMEKITIAIQDGNGQQYNFIGGMAQSWMFFNINDRDTIKHILLAGGNIKIRITIDVIGVISNYSFDFANANGFDVAYQQLFPN
jgi:hypothetical protein